MVFTTIQKFFPDEPSAGEREGTTPRTKRKRDRHPLLSNRRNIVVIADEAHRSQYDFIDGYARHMRDALPSASFIGFTGTPIELADASTRAVFGDHISVYDIQRAVEDGATVPIYYESRLARLALDEREKPTIDAGFEELTEGEEVDRREKLKTKWAQLEAIVGAEKRIALVARDIVGHFESRQEAMDGKAMVVCMSRRICIDLYRELTRLRPAWSDDDGGGALKVVMTGKASDPPDWQPHIRNKPRREALAKRFRDPADPLRIVLVRDMWLTGFDAPSLHTMYVDKPMRGHGLMQAIARVNRVFRDKPGGLVVDYLGLAHELKRALATCTESGGTGETALDQERAAAVMLEKYEICCGLFHGFDRTAWVEGTPAERLGLLPAAQEHVLAQENGKERCLTAVRALSQAFALAVPHAEAMRIRDDVAFFQAVRTALSKRAVSEGRADEELDHAVRQIVSRAVAPEGVLDIFAAAGLDKPDVSILSEEFLAEVRGMQRRNLAVELLQKLLTGELATRRRKNVVQARSFADMLDQTIHRYQNRANRDRPGHRGTDRHRPRTARSRRPWRGARPLRRRARLLRRARRQRQRGAGAGRRHAVRHRPRARHDGPRQRHHRLDPARECPRQPSPARQAHPAEARLPARQAGGRDAHGAGAGRGPVRFVGVIPSLPRGAAANINRSGLCGARRH